MLKMAEEVLLTETEEQRVHTHGVNAEESMGDEVGANHHSLVRTKRTINTMSHVERHHGSEKAGKT